MYTNISEDFFTLALSAPQNNEPQESSLFAPGSKQSLFKKDEIVGILKETYNEEFIRSGTHEVINGVYDWLEGKTEQPSYEVSLGEKANELASKLGGELKLRLSKLPECTYEELIKLDSSGFDPLTATCVPAQYDLNQKVDEYIAKYTEPDSFLHQAVLSNKSLNLSNEALEGMPKMFKTLDTLIIILPLLIIISASLYIFLIKKRLEGSEELASRFFKSGLFTFVGFLILLAIRGWFKGTNSSAYSGSGDQVGNFLQNIIGGIWSIAIVDIAKTGMIISVICALLGVGIWAICWYIKKHDAPLTSDKKVKA